MKKIGMLYLCTGPYNLFWEDYYESFENNFLNNVEKYYFVFTDDVEKINTFNNKNVKVIKIDNLPWPLITLLRFDYFLRVEEELKDMDYLMFTNSNVVCKNVVNEKEILPDENKTLFFVKHPGHFKKRIYNYPYDRNKKSLAYIPYNCGKEYVIGALFGGDKTAFLNMCHILKERIENDLKKNIIARWHDESHINRYIIKRNDIKFLNPGFCYPVGFELDFPIKIAGVSKMAKFDVQKFKGTENKDTGFKKYFKKVINRLKNEGLLFYIRDCICFKRIKCIK